MKIRCDVNIITSKIMRDLRYDLINENERREVPLFKN